MNDWETREGHVLELVIERFVLRDLPVDVRHSVKGHLRTCAICRARAEEIHMDLSIDLPPLDLSITRAPLPLVPAEATASTPRWAWPLLAAAGVLILVVGLWATVS